MAVGHAAALGIRQVRAALHDIEGGWEAESATHIRAVFEAAIDVAYLQVTSGTERADLARFYLAMSRLRLASIREGMEKNPASYTHGHREEWLALDGLFGAHAGVDPGNHWSGVGRGKVRTDAYEYLGKTMEGLDQVAKVAKRRIFEQFGSPVVHADPAAWLFVPKAADGRMRITADKTSGIHAMPLSTAALMLAWGVALRATERREAVRELFVDAERLLADASAWSSMGQESGGRK